MFVLPGLIGNTQRNCFDKTAAASTTTFDPANKDAAITLSNGNLTATLASGSAWKSVKSIASKSTGKYFFEFTNSGISNSVVGVGNASAATSNYCGADLNGVGWFQTEVLINGSGSGSLVTKLGDTLVCNIAVDLDAELFWGRVSGGNWNNSGAANPATGAGGISFSSTNAGPWYVMTGFTAATMAQTFNFGATAYTHAAPSGFGNWTG